MGIASFVSVYSIIYTFLNQIVHRMKNKLIHLIGITTDSNYKKTITNYYFRMIYWTIIEISINIV